jgi:hypothetical protein
LAIKSAVYKLALAQARIKIPRESRNGIQSINLTGEAEKTRKIMHTKKVAVRTPEQGILRWENQLGIK